MDGRYFNKNTSVDPTPVPAEFELGNPQSGDAETGVKATIPGPYRDYMIGQSLNNLIIGAGLTPDHTDLTLILQAVKQLGLPIKSKLLQPNGYIILNGGDQPADNDFIIQWKTHTHTHSSSVIESLEIGSFFHTIPFPNQLLFDSLTLQGVNEGYELNATVDNSDVVGVTFYTQRLTGSNSAGTETVKVKSLSFGF